MRDWDVYLITGQELSRGRTTPQVVEAALRAGVRVVQLREKDMSTRELLTLGQTVRALTRRFGAELIVNDRVDVALAIGADGVHVGQADMPLPYVRRCLPAHMYVGVSVSNGEQVGVAEQAGADYLGVGPIFPTGSKSDTDPVLGLDGLRAIRAQTSLPIVAVGGITIINAQDVIQAGADCVSVISALTAADDIIAAAEALLHKVRQAQRRMK
ncbi:MAG TPA: thiamine phosphate synthase [Firmicutes bacterium]|jgi:thiamine-phosphate diphosphorylase|nr:thiamine phosphate synthase [Bacillota bacterium]